MLQLFLEEMTSTFINVFSITDCLAQDRFLKTPLGYWPVDFRRFIIAKTGNIKNITKAAVILHNFLMRKSTRNMYCPPDYVDHETSQGLSPGSWRNEATEIQGLIDLRRQGSNNSTRAAKEVRNDSEGYFNYEHGKLSWQREIVKNPTNLLDEVD